MNNRNWLPAKDLGVVVLMTTTVLALYMPGHLRTLPLIPALVYILLNRNVVAIDNAIKIWAILFFAYIATFSLLAENTSTAWKGVYDILRGCLYFFTGYFFGKKLHAESHYPWLLLILAAVLAGSFLGYQEASGSGSHPAGFYGYHPNPNNAAFVVVVLLAFVLPVFFNPERSATGLLTGAAGTGMALVLLYYTNSRNAWIAVFLGLTVLTATTLRNNRTRLILLGSLEIILLAVVLLYFNQKGFSIPVRMESWTRLIDITVNDHIWLGHGINNTKEVLTAAGLPMLIAHNLFVDIFVSTGIIGTLVFSALIIGLVLIMGRNNYTDATAFHIGLCGLVMFGSISMFDLKFASITLIGAFAFFTGVVFSQSVKAESRQFHTHGQPGMVSSHQARHPGSRGEEGGL